MLRKFAVGLAAFGVLSAAQVQALGLGQMTVHSALNQPLEAEIDLLQLRGLTSSQIIATLAEANEFYLAGIEPQSVPSDISFQLDIQGGNARLLVRTEDPVREPFVNLLVEVNWPSGRLVKEYTLLLDPPAFSAQDLAPRVAPEPPRATRSTAEANAGDDSSPDSDVAPPSAADDADKAEQSSTYAVGRNDTLWNIALETRPDTSVSPQQMMLALQAYNPEAFINNNINRLRSGVVLEIPSAQEIAALAGGDPLAEVKRQNTAWRGGGEEGNEPGRQADASGDPDATATGAGQDSSRLRIVNADEGDRAQQAEAEGEALSSNTSAGATEDAEAEPSAQEKELLAQNERLEEQLVVAQEGIDKVERDNAELFQRLERITAQLESMQRLIELKDQQLAEMLQARQPDSEPTSSSGGLLERLLQAPALLAGLGAGVVAILGGLLWWVRRRRAAAAEEERAVEEALAVLEEREQDGAAEKADSSPAQEAASEDKAAEDEELSVQAEDESLEEASLAMDQDPNDPFNAISDEDVGDFDGREQEEGAPGELDMDLKIDEPLSPDQDMDDFADSLLDDDDFDLSLDDSTTDDLRVADDDAREDGREASEFGPEDAAPEENIAADTRSEEPSAAQEDDPFDSNELDALLADDEEDTEDSAAESYVDQSDSNSAGAESTEKSALEDDAEDDLDALLSQSGGDRNDNRSAEGSDSGFSLEEDGESAEDLLDSLFEDDKESSTQAKTAATGAETAAKSDTGLRVDGEDDLDRMPLETVATSAEDDEPLDESLDALFAGSSDAEEESANEQHDKPDASGEDGDHQADAESLDSIEWQLDDDDQADAQSQVGDQSDDDTGAEDSAEESAEESAAEDTSSGSQDDYEFADEDLTLGELMSETEDTAVEENQAEKPQATELELDDDEPAEPDAVDSLLQGLPDKDDGEESIDFDAVADEAEPADDSTSKVSDSEARAQGLELEDNLDRFEDDELEKELNQMLEEEGNELSLDETLEDDESADAGLDYLEDADEVGTKLDLARAYLDMDDREGASDILEEVLREGSEQQVSEARKLLDSLKS